MREAYLLLREREKAGVEPISKVWTLLRREFYLTRSFLKDLVDPAKLLAHLPTDEELREAGVVINI